MTKTEAIAIFGTVKQVAAALGVTVHAIYMWPDELNQKTIDQVTGASLRLGIVKPRNYKPSIAA